MKEIIEKREQKNSPKILVVGVGGGGNNALDRMISFNDFLVTYIAVNTDMDVLNDSNAENKVSIGRKLTGGFGAGGNPEIGAASADESELELSALFEGSQMVILTGGMGGGTGSGAIPVIAKLCKSMNILTVAIVTKPFSFESRQRMQIAEQGIEKLRDAVDTLLVIPNDKLLTISEKGMFLEDAFNLADTVLKNTIDAITNIIFNSGTVNLDFNDLKSVLINKGEAHLGISITNENTNLLETVKNAINSPLLETSLVGASHILINTSGKIDLAELNNAISYVQEIAGNDTYIMWGTVTPKEKTEEICVTIIATGLGTKNIPKRELTPHIPSDKIKNAVVEKEINIPTFLKKYR